MACFGGVVKTGVCLSAVANQKQVTPMLCLLARTWTCAPRVDQCQLSDSPGKLSTIVNILSTACFSVVHVCVVVFVFVDGAWLFFSFQAWVHRCGFSHQLCAQRSGLYAIAKGFPELVHATFEAVTKLLDASETTWWRSTGECKRSQQQPTNASQSQGGSRSSVDTKNEGGPTDFSRVLAVATEIAFQHDELSTNAEQHRSPTGNVSGVFSGTPGSSPQGHQRSAEGVGDVHDGDVVIVDISVPNENRSSAPCASPFALLERVQFALALFDACMATPLASTLASSCRVIENVVALMRVGRRLFLHFSLCRQQAKRVWICALHDERRYLYCCSVVANLRLCVGCPGTGPPLSSRVSVDTMHWRRPCSAW